MENRHTLHFKHLESFKKWLIENDWEIKPLSNSKYEVLRVKRDCEWVIVYKKDDAKEHYSLSDKANFWVNRWIRETQIRQDERAKVVGVSRATVSNWERGFVVPDPDNIKKLIEFCKENKIRITR